MTTPDAIAWFVTCADDYEAAADQALKDIDYAEVIDAIREALFGDWDGATLH